jgi:hypothetical protein
VSQPQQDGVAQVAKGRPAQRRTVDIEQGAREELEPWFAVSEGRLTRPGVHPDHWKMNFRSTLSVTGPALSALCGALNSEYAKGLAGKAAARADAESRMKGGVPDYTGAPLEAMDGYVAASHGQFASEVLAEALLRIVDDLIDGLSYPLRKPTLGNRASTNTKSGRLLSGRIAVDELLNAFGNAPRHRPEWVMDPQKGAANLNVLARFYSDRPDDLSIEESSSIVRGTTEQALRIVDAIAPGRTEYPVVSYERLMETIEETGNRIIDEHWPAWCAVENKRREHQRERQRQREQEVKADEGVSKTRASATDCRASPSRHTNWTVPR